MQPLRRLIFLDGWFHKRMLHLLANVSLFLRGSMDFSTRHFLGVFFLFQYLARGFQIGFVRLGVVGQAIGNVLFKDIAT